MKAFLVAWLPGLAVGWIVMFAIEPFGLAGDGWQFFSGVIGFGVFLYVIRQAREGMTVREIFAALVPHRREERLLSQAKKNLADGTYLAIVESEIDRGEIDERLWTKALVEADGAEARRKVEYMKLRARQLETQAPQDA